MYNKTEDTNDLFSAEQVHNSMANYKNEFGKIDLPWMSTPEPPSPRAALTQHYWMLSQSWNNRPGNLVVCNITVAGAFVILNEILNNTDPKTKLACLGRTLNDDIIQHGTKRQKEKSQKSTTRK